METTVDCPSSTDPGASAQYAKLEDGGGEEELRLEWEVDVSVRGKEIVRGAYGGVGSGELVALLGPSGAGKTTLLKALCGRLGEEYAVRGSVELTQAAGPSAFVEQDLTIHSTETPREAIRFSAALRTTAGAEAREALVSQMLERLSLADCADVMLGGDGMISGCSGGERRRCAIGVELVTSPRLLFCDEPTSGLDSYAALVVVRLLGQLCADNRAACLCTIHQPSGEVFSAFDAGRDEGDATSLQPECSRSDAPEESMARFEFAPSDDRSS